MPVVNILAGPASSGPGEAAAPGAEVRGRPGGGSDRGPSRGRPDHRHRRDPLVRRQGERRRPAGFVGMTAKMIARAFTCWSSTFPSPEHDPQVHKAIWDELEELDFAPPDDRPLIVASYDSGPMPVSTRSRSRPGNPARDAAVPQAGFLRLDATGGLLSVGLGPLPRRVERVARALTAVRDHARPTSPDSRMLAVAYLDRPPPGFARRRGGFTFLPAARRLTSAVPASPRGATGSSGQRSPGSWPTPVRCSRAHLRAIAANGSKSRVTRVIASARPG